jgi:hypothetical protein
MDKFTNHETVLQYKAQKMSIKQVKNQRMKHKITMANVAKERTDERTVLEIQLDNARFQLIKVNMILIPRVLIS